MRHVAFAILLVLGVPQIAAAAPIDIRSEPVVTDGALFERVAAPAQGLDLRTGGVRHSLAQAPDGADDSEFPWRKGDFATEQPRSDRGLSFGLELKQRSRFGALARKDDAEDQSLGDQLDRLIERPVFGLRGRYRF